MGRAGWGGVVSHGGEPVSVRAEAGVEVNAPRAWDEVSAAGLDTEVVEPLRSWRLQYAADAATLGLDLRAVGAVAALDPEHPAARAGGMTGFEQAVRVTGTATLRGQRVSVDALGQRGHSW